MLINQITVLILHTIFCTCIESCLPPAVTGLLMNTKAGFATATAIQGANSIDMNKISIDYANATVSVPSSKSSHNYSVTGLVWRSAAASWASKQCPASPT